MSSADLTELLRAAKPVAPESLRERVRALAETEPAPQARWAFRLPRLRIALPAAAATAIAAAAVVAVVQPGSEKPQQTVTRAQKQLDAYANGSAPKLAPRAPLPATGDAGATRAATTPAPPSGRAVDYQAQLGIEVANGDALSDATKRAQQVARDLGGYVVSVSYDQASSGAASLTVRVPTGRVQDAIGRLAALGKIVSQHVQIDDVQGQLDAYDRQVVVLRTRIAHLTALLAAGGLTTERVAQLQAQRDELQTQLRRVRQTRAATAVQAALATLQLELHTKTRSHAVPPPPSRIDRTLHQAGRVLAWEGIALLFALVVAAPFALAGAALWTAARARRRGEERRLLARP